MGILRVISGTAKGHKLKTLSGISTRPTSDRVKESLFNIIAPYIPGSMVLDIFAGTGSLGIEALSRGAEYAVFVDESRESAGIINDNLVHTKLKEKARIINRDYRDAIALLAAEAAKFDIIFLDPPYNKNFVQNTLKYLEKNDIINENGMLIAEHYIKDVMPKQQGKLQLVRSERYGDTMLSFFKAGMA